jgi:uncharacterized protein
MSKSFVKDPRAVAKPGDIVRVRVLEVDTKRRRISLTMRLDDPVGAKAPPAPAAERGRAAPADRRRGEAAKSSPGGALADAFRKAGLGKDEPASAGPGRRTT